MKKELYSVYAPDELSQYEKDNMIVSYANLFRDNDSLILCNNIVEDYEELEQVSGFNYDDEDDYSPDIYQYYIIDDYLAERLKEINEIVFYHNRLDIYVLGVTHFGTSWSYVNSGLYLEKDENGLYYAYYDIQEDK